MDPNDVENPNQEKAPKKRRSGCLVRAAILCLIPFLLVVFLLVAVGWVQAKRTLPEPRNFRPSPLVLAVLKAGNGGGLPQPATGTAGTLPIRADSKLTSSTVMAGQGEVTGGADSPEIATSLFELFPESEFDRPELKRHARQCNASFRQWVDLLRLYEQDPVKFKDLPQAKAQPQFGPDPQYWYYYLESEMAIPSLGAAYEKKQSDACLQLLVHYGEWEAASRLCWSGYTRNLYSWEDTLYALRQIPKPLVKYPRIVVWTGMRQVFKVMKAVNKPAK